MSCLHFVFINSLDIASGYHMHTHIKMAIESSAEFGDIFHLSPNSLLIIEIENSRMEMFSWAYMDVISSKNCCLPSGNPGRFEDYCKLHRKSSGKDWTPLKYHPVFLKATCHLFLETHLVQHSWSLGTFDHLKEDVILLHVLPESLEEQ